LIDTATRPTARELVRYFLYLGSLGLGGPAALVGSMQRDLVEKRRWFTLEEYKKSLVLSQIAPGPLAAQLAICLGFIHSRVRGATLVGLAFILPSYLMTVVIGMLYVRYGGLSWMQAVFYGVGATVVAIIARAAWKLNLSTNRRDRLLWAIGAVSAALTVVTESEGALVFLAAGVLVMLVEAPPAWVRRVRGAPTSVWAVAPLWLYQGLGEPAGSATIWSLLAFFTKAGAFVFGSGLAIVPFLYGGVVQEYRWLNDQQFLDAVAVAMITPGPVVITVAFIGYLVAGQVGALVAAIGVFLPVYFFVVIPFPWFDRWSGNPQLKAFVNGVTAATTGAIAGACVVLARRAIYDVPTLLIGAAALTVVWRLKVPEPLLIAAGAAVGLLIFWVRG
jgi:chromate transporter